MNNSLSDNLLYVYYMSQKEDRKNKLLYFLSCLIIAQAFVGNEKTLRFSIPIGIICTLAATYYKLLFNTYVRGYLKSIENLQNVSKELMLLGYDLDINAMFNCTLFDDGLIEYKDKYNNKYYLYECIKDNEEKYYSLINDDVEECLNTDGMSEDITKIIKKALNK